MSVLGDYKNIRKILLLGASGQVGSEIIDENSLDFDFLSPSRSELDLKNISQIIDFIKTNSFDLIINAAAYTDVDLAEKEKDDAKSLNYNLPKLLSFESNKRDIGFIHISTDYVFGDDKHGPHKPNNKKNPQNYYGLTKSQGEDEILLNHKNPLIIRLASVFSKYKINFIKKIIELIYNNKIINVVSDQKISITNANIFSKNLKSFINFYNNKQQNNFNSNIIHFTDIGYTTWYDVSLQILEVIRELDPTIDCKINPIKAIEWKSDAKRPYDSRLELDEDFIKINNIYTQDWKTSVKSTVELIYNDYYAR